MIYTLDCDDIPDVFRVLLQIKKYFKQYNKINSNLVYKTDEATKSGKYGNNKRARSMGWDEAAKLEENEYVTMYTSYSDSQRGLRNNEKLIMVQNNLGNDFHRDVVASVDSNNEVSYYVYGQRSYDLKKNETEKNKNNKQILNEEAIQFIEV
jgi:hypothetical protein